MTAGQRRMRGVQGVAAADSIGAVQAAVAGAGSRGGSHRHGQANDFLSAPLSPALRRLGVLYAIYLCFASLRIAEVITPLAIPKLPMVMALVLVMGLILGVPGMGWTLLWRFAPALRWQALLLFLAVTTIPLGIWISQSLELLHPGYTIANTVFVVGLVLMRDRDVLLRTLQILTGTLGILTGLVFLGVGASVVGSEGRLQVGESLDPNDFAWILATFVPIALWLGVRRRGTAIIWFSIAALLVMGIVPTQSRGGFLALLAAGIVLILMGATGWRRLLMMAALMVLGAGFMAYTNSTGASRLTDFSGYEGGTGRTDLWKQGIKWMVQRPWGMGMGNYNTYNTWMTRSGHGAHSAYVGIGVELGVLGIVAFLSIWGGVIRALARIRKNALGAGLQADGRAEATFVGFILAAMAANMVGSAFLNTQYASLTLFVQALGAAIILSSPWRTGDAPHPKPELTENRRGKRRIGPATAQSSAPPVTISARGGQRMPT